MSAITIVKPGGSIPFFFDRGGESIRGWTLEVFIKQRPEDDYIIGPFEVETQNGCNWQGYFAASTTDELEPSNIPYYIIGVITNQDTNEKQQIDGGRQRFHIQSSWES